MNEIENTEDIIFNDLKDEPIVYGFYHYEIIIAFFIVLVSSIIMIQAKLGIVIIIVPVGIYLLLFLKWTDKDSSIFVALKREITFWVLEQRHFTKGE